MRPFHSCGGTTTFTTGLTVSLPFTPAQGRYTGNANATISGQTFPCALAALASGVMIPYPILAGAGYTAQDNNGLMTARPATWLAGSQVQFATVFQSTT